MFESIANFFKKLSKKEKTKESSDTAKERLHLVLMQDRANVSADFLELMKQEIIEVIKKYIDIDEAAIDVKLTNKTNEDGTVGAPALYANIPIITIKNDARKMNAPKEDKAETTEESKTEAPAIKEEKEEPKQENVAEEKTQEEQSKEESIAEKNEEVSQEENSTQNIQEEQKEGESGEKQNEEQKATEQVNS